MFKWLWVVLLVMFGFVSVLLGLGYLLQENEKTTTALKQQLDQQKLKKQTAATKKTSTQAILKFVDKPLDEQDITLKYQQLKIIMIHENFAQLGEFERKTEVYQLSAFFHLNSESLLVGQEAHILIRPKLTINGRKASLKLLKNCSVKLST